MVYFSKEEQIGVTTRRVTRMIMIVRCLMINFQKSDLVTRK